MNVKELAENLGLEEDEFLELVELFVGTSASNLTDLAKALEAGDPEEVVKASHSLKGAAGNLGFQEIYERAKFMKGRAKTKKNFISELTHCACGLPRINSLQKR